MRYSNNNLVRGGQGRTADRTVTDSLTAAAAIIGVVLIILGLIL